MADNYKCKQCGGSTEPGNFTCFGCGEQPIQRVQWISVEDKKPGVYESVLIWCKHEEDGDRMLMGHRMHKSKWRIGVWGGQGLVDDEWSVTHWMPLLEGPR